MEWPTTRIVSGGMDSVCGPTYHASRHSLSRYRSSHRASATKNFFPLGIYRTCDLRHDLGVLGGRGGGYVGPLHSAGLATVAGPRRDGISDETGLLPSWPAGRPKRLWTASEIGNGYSSPIVVDGTLYVTGDQDDDLIITALSTDGSLRWRSANGAAWQGSHPGARSSCTYDDGKLYHMNAHGRVACLDAAAGRKCGQSMCSSALKRRTSHGASASRC